MDFISQLPEPILHDILYRLSARDAARTCVLSKAWYVIQCQIPFLHICGINFPSASSMLNDVEKHLERRFSNNNNNNHLDILSFTFCSTFAALPNNDRVSCLIKRVMNNCPIQKLNLNIWEYRLSNYVLQSDRLTTLSLRYCECDSHVDVCLPKLTTLDLSDAAVDNRFINRLTRECHLLQHLNIKRCKWLTAVRVTCLKMLQTVSIIECKHLNVVEIMSPNLHSFWYAGKTMPCGNLIFSPTKELTLEFTTIEKSWLQQQLSACEELTLNSIDFVDDIHISSQKLKRLKIQNTYNMKNVARIDCPNLESLVYIGNPLQFCSVCEFKSLRKVRTL